MTGIGEHSVKAISKYIARLEERKLEAQEFKNMAIRQHAESLRLLEEERRTLIENHREVLTKYNADIAELNHSLGVMIPAKDKLIEGD